MVNTKIHIICGNCWCNDEWTLRVDATGDEIIDDETSKVTGYRPKVALLCGSCITLHFLDENLMKRVDE